MFLRIIIFLFFSFTLIVHSSLQVPSSIQIINYKNISSSSILLYWDPPEYPNGKITHYTIYAMELDTNRAFQMTTTDNSFLITGRTIFFKTFLFWWKYASLSALNTAGHMLYHFRLRCAVLPWISWKIRASITWLNGFLSLYLSAKKWHQITSIIGIYLTQGTLYLVHWNRVLQAWMNECENLLKELSWHGVCAKSIQSLQSAKTNFFSFRWLPLHSEMN